MMVDRLAKIEAAVSELEGEEPTTPESAEEELVFEGDNDPEAVVAEGEEDAQEQSQEGNEDPHRVSIPTSKLTKLRRRARGAEDQATGLASENDELKRQLQQQGDQLNMLTQTVKKPQYTDFATDADFEASLLQWHRLNDSGTPAPAPAAAPPQPQQRQAPDHNPAVNAHYDRAEQTKGLDLGKFQVAEQNMRAALSDGLTDAIIASFGEGSEVATYIIGQSPARLAKVKQLLAEDPNGFRLTRYMQSIVDGTRTRGKTISNAPRPTRSPSGGVADVSAASSALQKKYDKADKAGDANALFRAQRDARKQGVTLK
jgi:hypothetical protein